MRMVSHLEHAETRTREGRSTWSLLKEFLSKVDIDQSFTRSEILEYVYCDKYKLFLSGYVTNVDLYRRYLMNIGFVEFVRSTIYIKRYHIPKNASLQLIMKYSYPKRSWKNWFIPTEDKIQKIIEECELNHVL